MVLTRRAWLPAIFPVLLATPAMAEARDARARLHHCGAETCLRIEGERADPGAPIRVAGREVTARGGRRFRVSLPMSTIRDWSAPFARTIALSIGGSGGAQLVRLPTGLLGHVTELASLEIRAP